MAATSSVMVLDSLGLEFSGPMVCLFLMTRKAAKLAVQITLFNLCNLGVVRWYRIVVSVCLGSWRIRT